MSTKVSQAVEQVYNFSPGPAAMPREVMERVQAELLDYKGLGISVMEISHRNPVFEEISAALHQNLRALLAIPSDFELLFLAGGAQCQFSGVPLNLLADYSSAAYLITGHWSRKAHQEAQRYTNALVVADAEDSKYFSVPDRGGWSVPEDAAYLYYCDNETVHGLMLPEVPDVSLPLVCDMTSSLITRPVEWSRYAAVIASSQKNIAPAGFTVVAVRKDMLERKANSYTPRVLNYKEQFDAQSIANTPVTFSWYVANLVCEYYIAQGGIDEMYRRCQERARILYECIDDSDKYVNNIEVPFRSDINVVFQLVDPSREEDFLEQAVQNGLYSLKGHRAVGGIRANLYNSMPIEGVQKLVDFMRSFS